MTHPLAFDFSVNRENHTVTVTREFNADLSSVWEAFTDRDILDQWWAPKPWKSKTKSMEFKEGGIRNYAMLGPEGEEHWAMFRYDKIQKPTYFAGLDGFTDAEGVLNPDMPSMQWEFNFRENGDRTTVEMLIKLGDLKQLETILEMGFQEGFTMALGNLDEVLSK